VVAALVADRVHLLRGELWRLLSGPLVHATGGHLVRDGSYCAALGALYEPVLGPRFRRALLVGLVGPSLLVVLLHPGLRGYSGLSGAAHTLSALAVVHELRSRSGRTRWLVAGLAAVMAGKLLHEAGSGSLLFALSLGPDAVPVPAAHLYGATLGAVVGWSDPRWRTPGAVLTFKQSLRLT